LNKKSIAERRQYPAVKDSYKDYEYDLKIAKEKVSSAKMFFDRIEKPNIKTSPANRHI
jgi:hypothetical protein